MEEKYILAIIPARGGSKGVPGKHIKEFTGEPLIVYSIEASLKCSLVNRTAVCTDDDKIAEISDDVHLAKDLSKIPEVSIIDWHQ